jgi:thioredoxin 1
MSQTVLEITDTNFDQEVVQSSDPFLLDLSAEWCGPCRALAPVVEELSRDYNGKVRFGKLDIDANPKVPSQFMVRSVPTLLLFNKGKVVGQLVGAHPRQRIEELIGKAQ